MASSKEYLAFILEQLSGLEDVSYRAMMANLSSITAAASSAEFTTTACWSSR